MEQIIKNIQNTLNKDKCIIGVSGGVDSMVLLDLVIKAIDKNQIIICHINHGLRKESEIEEEYLLNYAKANNVQIEVEHLNLPKENIEATARSCRYNFFKKIAKEKSAKYILTAHHADDDIETIMMRIIKGSSLKAYAGIEKMSTLDEFIIYRPLLSLTKETLEEYAKANNLTYFTDVTNAEDYYMRNKIRNKIIPELKEINPNIYDAFNHFKEHIQNANLYLEDIKVDFEKNHLEKTPNYTSFKIKDLKVYSPYLQKQILYRLTKEYELSEKQIEELLKIIDSAKTKIISCIAAKSKNLGIIKEYGKITFTTVDLKERKLNIDLNNIPDEYKNIIKFSKDANKCSLTINDQILCYNITSSPSSCFILRNRRNGDKILNKVGNLKNLSDYLTAKKIPYLTRKNLLFLEVDGVIREIIDVNL